MCLWIVRVVYETLMSGKLAVMIGTQKQMVSGKAGACITNVVKQVQRLHSEMQKKGLDIFACVLIHGDPRGWHKELPRWHAWGLSILMMVFAER